MSKVGKLALGIEEFMGREVFVQLKDSQLWMGVCSEDGEPRPILAQQQGAPRPEIVHAPFVQGKALRYEEPFLFLEYKDQNRSVLVAALHQDTVACVTMVVEQAAVHIIQPE